MAATNLFAGDAAIIAFNADEDSLVLLFREAVGAGTTVYLTDRAWDGSAFASAAGDGAISLAIGPVDFAAGLAVRFTAAQLAGGGVELSDAGETLYLYQGADADTPDRFLFALDMADGNQTFDGSLAHTGLTQGLHTAAIGADNAAFGTRLHNIQEPVLDAQIGNPGDWNRNDASPQPLAPTFAFLADPPHSQLFVAGAGGGDAIVMAEADDEPILGDIATRILHALQGDPASPDGDHLYQPRDVTLDTVHDRFFFVDSDRDGHNRIVQGRISDLLEEPGGPLDLTILYSNADTGLAGAINSLSVDTVNRKVYFGENTRVERIDYDSGDQIPVVLADLFTQPLSQGPFSYTNQIAIDYSTGTVWLASSYVHALTGNVASNRLFTATAASADGLAAAPANSLVFTPLPFLENDTTFGDPDVPSLGLEHWPKEKGVLTGIDVDPATGFIYFVARTILVDTSTAQDGSEPTTFYGGIYRYDPTNAASLTTLFLQDGINGPTGNLSYIEADPVAGLYYVSDRTGVDSGTGGIWTGSLSTPATPSLFAEVANNAGLGPMGLEIQHAPTLTGIDAGAAQNETAGNPSPDPAAVQPASGFTAGDADSGGDPEGDELARAQVRISSGFLSGAGHQDVLTINGAQSGTLIFGADTIDYSFDAASGVLTLTGSSTFANYEAALADVRFQATGDNPTGYGSSGSRTLAYAVFDGLLYSDEVLATIAVTALNDAPVNNVGASLDIDEDAPAANVTGVSIADVDANPASDPVSVTLDVDHGTLAILTNVAGGITAGDIVSQDADTISIVATINQINTTLAAPGSLTYDSDADYFGTDTLELTTSDLGATGQDPIPGTGTNLDEQDVDSKVINIAAVNDAPVLDLNGTDPGTGASLAYNEGQTLTLIAPAATISDEDSSDFDTGTLIVGIIANAEEGDRIGVQDQGTAAGQITLGEAEVYYNFGRVDGDGNPIGPEQIGSFFGGTDGFTPLTILLNSTADAEAVQALARAIGFYNITTTLVDADRTVGWTLTDGDGGTSAATSATVDVTVIDEPAIANDDLFFTDEDAPLSRDLFADNGNSDDYDPDGTAFVVTEVDGDPNDVGQTISLTSGALLTVHADGSFDYDPNGQFDHLSWWGSGAVNSSATESFSYTITGGDTATVTISIYGVVSPGDRFEGDSDNNRITGTPQTDFFFVMQGGSDDLAGMAGNDAFLFGDSLDAGDMVDGGEGVDQLGIQGDYSGALTLGPNSLVSIETFVLLSGTDTRFGDSGQNLYDYNIATVDENVPAGGLLKVQFNTLVAGEDVVFDGSAELDGAFFLYAGQGTDDLTGGAGDDAFFFGHNGSSPAFSASDSVDGGGGRNDQLGLRGDYSALVTFGADTMQNVEVLVAISSTDVRFGRTGSNFHYNLKTDDANVGEGDTLSVTGAMLTATEGLTFDGSAELDGHFDFKGGKGTDVFSGGALADLIFGNEGQDMLTGGGGEDIFRYRSPADSAVGSEDRIADFTVGDKIDLTLMDANSTTPVNDAFTFSEDGDFHDVAGELRTYESVPGTWFAEGDVDGDGDADFAIQVDLTNPAAPLVVTDFNL